MIDWNNCKLKFAQSDKSFSIYDEVSGEELPYEGTPINAFSRLRDDYEWYKSEVAEGRSGLVPMKNIEYELKEIARLKQIPIGQDNEDYAKKKNRSKNGAKKRRKR